jgi:TRAP-type C4-dicarboxylate transport system substrate-binding protein
MENLGWTPPGLRFAHWIDELSGGRLTLDMKVGVIPDQEAPVAVAEGRVDMGRFYNGFQAGTHPLWDYEALPFFFEDTIPGFHAYEKASNDPRVVDILEKSYMDAGLVYLGQTPKHVGAGQIYGRSKHLETLAEWDGAKIRATGMLVNWAMEAAGAKPITLVGTGVNVPEALTKGLYDYAIGDNSFHLTIGTALAAPYISVWPIAPLFTSSVVINPDKWNELPPDLQNILQAAVQDIGREVAYAATVSEIVARKAITALGGEYYRPSDDQIQEIRELTQPPVVAKWLEIAGPDGPSLLSVISEYAGGAVK